jgi:hypothetical protein
MASDEVRTDLLKDPVTLLKRYDPNDEEPWHCDKCGAVCDSRVGYCECGPKCPYPPRV